MLASCFKLTEVFFLGGLLACLHSRIFKNVIKLFNYSRMDNLWVFFNLQF